MLKKLLNACKLDDRLGKLAFTWIPGNAFDVYVCKRKARWFFVLFCLVLFCLALCLNAGSLYCCPVSLTHGEMVVFLQSSLAMSVITETEME